MNPLKRFLRDFYPSPYPSFSGTCTWDRPCIRSRIVDAIVIVVLFTGLCLFVAVVLLMGCAAPAVP